jgi:class 3 adenylate cyclase
VVFGPIKQRQGSGTGEVRADRGQARRLTISISARVAANAGPSEVLVSSSVKDLVAGSGFTFEAAGDIELKGLPDRWHLYRVAA